MGEQFRNGKAAQTPARTGTGPEGLPPDNAFTAVAIRDGVDHGQVSRQEATSWLDWRVALYALLLGTICVLLVPLTSLWWVVPVLGAAVPVTLAILDRPTIQGSQKAKERELLHALAERGALTPTNAAIRTSLTVEEASMMMGELAHEGYLALQAEEGVATYSLQRGDRLELPGEVERPSRQKLDEPLSEREIEVLNGLASGRTNSEVARDLYISVGTVKSHTNNIYRKLGARNRTGALARARGLNLLSG